MRGPSIVLVSVLGLSHAALAQNEPPSYGLDFVRVGAAGNAGYRPPRGYFPTGRLEEGAVAYEYRIARTEMTAGHWLEFVNAYAPYHTGSPIQSAFTGDLVFWTGIGTTYEISPMVERWPIQVGFEFAARYCKRLRVREGDSIEVMFPSGGSRWKLSLERLPRDREVHGPAAEHMTRVRTRLTQCTIDIRPPLLIET